MKRYAIWNKQDPVITPIGEVLTAEQWKEKFPVAALDSITVICAAGEVNGGLFDTLGQMVQRYEAQGCDFSTATTDEEKLATIEAFEDAQAEAAQQAAQEQAEQEAANAAITAESLATLAANSEFQTMMMLPDEEETV